jgi:60 kDa SS-A/Ro ribonucleoprotein
MSTPYAGHLSTPTPQTEPLPGQVANSAGGFTFAVDDWSRLDRFLILGAEGGSYYVSERKLTLDNAKCVERCVSANGPRTVARIVEISDAGRAPKNDPALLALAIAAKKGNAPTRAAALSALPKVARIGTHLFHFAEYLQAVGGGWGRGTTRAFANWYLAMDGDRLALQAVKYQSRDGWSHRDILRKAHPKTADARRQAIFHWIVKGWDAVGADPPPDEVLARIWAFERAKKLTGPTDAKELVRLIETYRLPHECVPTEAKQIPAVWEALLPEMGLTAMVRNLGKLTEVGVLAPMSAAAALVRDKLGDVESLRAARLHPMAILVALRTYTQGRGDKGQLTWSPVQTIVDALDGAFYTAFKAVEPTGRRHLLAIDISGSMGGARIAGSPLTCRDASAAMALVTANVEPEHALFGFCTDFRPLEISARDRLDRAIKYMNGLPMGGTDCSQPIVHATKNKLPVDVFCVYTDNETYAGAVHPHEALEEHRQRMGRPAKLVVLGMAANQFTIADPNDAGMLDVVGFDTATPAVLADFARQ